MSGYAAGREMVEALMGAELAHRQAKEGGDQRPLREREIETRTDAVMNEREAMAIVHYEKQGEIIAAELRVLAARRGGVRRPMPLPLPAIGRARRSGPAR